MKKFIKRKPNLMTLSGVVLIILSMSLLILLYIFKAPQLQEWYERYLIYLEELEIRIASFDSKWIILFVIWILFSIKACVPLPIPISCICVISGMVFSPIVSFLINMFGMIITFILGYHVGTKVKVIPYRILRSYTEIWNVLKHDGNGNPWLLIVCRLVPLFPINTVSNIYGGMKYDFKKYLIISSLGFTPKLVSYLIIGHNAYNPFSATFLVPVTVSCLFAGIGLLLTRRAIIIINKKKGENK